MPPGSWRTRHRDGARRPRQPWRWAMERIPRRRGRPRRPGRRPGRGAGLFARRARVRLCVLKFVDANAEQARPARQDQGTYQKVALGYLRDLEDQSIYTPRVGLCGIDGAFLSWATRICSMAWRCRAASASTSTPSTRRLLDGVAMSVPHRSTEPARPRHRREMNATHWLISGHRCESGALGKSLMDVL